MKSLKVEECEPKVVLHRLTYCPPIGELLTKENGSPLVRIPFKEANLLMFRNQTTVQCNFLNALEPFYIYFKSKALAHT